MFYLYVLETAMSFFYIFCCIFLVHKRFLRVEDDIFKIDAVIVDILKREAERMGVKIVEKTSPVVDPTFFNGNGAHTS